MTANISRSILSKIIQNTLKFSLYILFIQLNSFLCNLVKRFEGRLKKANFKRNTIADRRTASTEVLLPKTIQKKLY